MISYIKYLWKSKEFVTPWQYKAEIQFHEDIVSYAKRVAKSRKKSNRIKNLGHPIVHYFSKKFSGSLLPSQVQTGTLLELQAKNMAFIEQHPEYFDEEFRLKILFDNKFRSLFN